MSTPDAPHFLTLPDGTLIPTHCTACGATAGESPKCLACGNELADPRLGKIVASRYRIDALLGAGGFGRVYRATHLALGEPVAIKFLLAELSQRGDLRVRFKREATALARLRHPGIVAVHDYGEHADELYMAMEFIRGVTLNKVAQRADEPMSVPRVLAIVDQVLQVLEAAHAASIVHRDIKPENVMLLAAGDRVDRVKVLDFGLALMPEGESVSRLTRAGAMQGTPIYMSPEQWYGRDVGAPTDVYAVGVMLFELLAGAPPFNGDTMPELAMKHVYTPAPTISETGIKRAVSPAVEALVRHALAKAAADRPTAAQMRDVLAQIVRGDDEVTAAERAVQLRVMAATLARDGRALPTPEVTTTSAAAPVAATPAAGDPPGVVIWGSDVARVEALRGALAVQGLGVTRWLEAALPASVDARAVRTVVVADVAAGDRVRALRKHPTLARVPVLAIDVAGVEATTTLIRAGASDVVAAGVADAEIGQRVWRLVRRGR